MQLLLEHRADPNAVAKSSVTPQHQAVAWDTHLDSAAIVAALLDAGADEHATDAHGRTPLALATQAKGGAAPAVLAALQRQPFDGLPRNKAEVAEARRQQQRQ